MRQLARIVSAERYGPIRLVLIALMAVPALSAAEPELRVAGETLTIWRERMAAQDPRDERNAEYVPGLIALIESSAVPWFTRRQAALTLGRWNATAAVPVLIRLLEDVGDDPDLGPQQWSLKALSRFGPAAAPATPRIVAIVLAESTPRVNRLNGVEALSQIGAAHPLVIPTLTDLAEGANDLELQIVACESLGAIGPPALTALPTLIRRLDEPDESLRHAACAALGRFGPRGEPAATALIERLLLDDSPLVQDAATTALSQFGPGVGPEIVPLCDAPDERLRRAGLTILSSWGRAAIRWRTEIERGWSDDAPTVRLAAFAAGIAIGRDSRAMAERLVPLVVDEDRVIRRDAVRLLVRLGPEAARPVLATLVDHPRAEVRTAVRAAFHALEQP